MSMLKLMDSPIVTLTFGIDAGSMRSTDVPSDLPDSFITQAIQQLDQHQRFAVIALVCRLWHSFVVATSQNIAAAISTDAAAEQLSPWFSKHGQEVEALDLELNLRDRDAAGAAAEGVVEALGTTPKLWSLSLTGPSHRLKQPGNPLRINLSPLSGLTALKLSNWQLDSRTISSLISLKDLRTLDLSSCEVGSSSSMAEELFQNMSTSLPQLSSLDLSSAWVLDGPDTPELQPVWLTSLRSLSQLKKLYLESSSCKPDDLSSLSGLPVTGIAITLSTRNDTASFADWVGSSGQHLEKAKVCGGSVRLDAFRSSPRLQHLELCHSRYAVRELGMLTQLTSLNINSGRFSAMADIHGPAGIDIAGLCALHPMHSLQSLHLRGDSMQHIVQIRDMEDLEKRLPKLTSLLVTDKGIADAAKAAFKDRIESVVERNARSDTADQWTFTLAPARNVAA